MDIVMLRFPRTRAALHFALALLVLVAAVHCTLESQHALAGSLAAATHREAGTPLPFSLPHGCENESGCFCRGATQAREVNLSFMAAEASEFLAAAESLLVPVKSFSVLLPALWHVLDEPRSISGRQLRALYASFLI